MERSTDRANIPVKETDIQKENDDSSEDELAEIAPEVDSDTVSESEEDSIIVQPWTKPQIVTYSSRFVDKLSDVTGEFTRI